MNGIFISHCEDDRPAADTLRSALAELAVPALCDFVSLSSAVSPRPLGDEVTAAAALVALFSSRALRDLRIMVEVGTAVSLGKPVVAVVLDGTDPRDLDFVEATAWIPSAAADDPAGLARLIHRTLSDLL
jgi:hypothetical protein